MTIDLQKIFHKQFAHAGLLSLLLALLYGASFLNGALEGEFLEYSTLFWGGAAVANAILHQLYTWLCWRLELYGKNLTRLLGDKAFPLYAFLFAALIIARPIFIFLLALSNAGSLELDPLAGKLIAGALGVPFVWLLYSVHRYFGMKRAFGIDHFDSSYRDESLVQKGIFRYTSNGMYIFGFFILWMPGFYFGSIAALAVAAFMHAYIWVHYYCTEKPDMEEIYGRGEVARKQ